MSSISIGLPGIAGQSGSQPADWPVRGVAPYAKDGEYGMPASAAKPGSNGQDVHIRLHYLDSDPGMVQASVEGSLQQVQGGPTSDTWRVGRDQELFIDCRGGNGGDGGHGQDGQDGGEGIKGKDANRWRDAQNGGQGGRGGDAGAGSNGAAGGDAGNAFITVGEDDLDLLIACRWNTSGGKGGKSGVHGMPGTGGIGGAGGAGYTYTERYGDRTYTRQRAPGAPGPQGGPGAQPASYLMAGQNGKDGSTQIRVLMKNLTEGTYAGRYDLEVVGFDVLDENDDGINEPGEHLLVRNIRVRNNGIMPSPGPSVPIHILIQGTQWLEPIVTEPVEMPPSIQPGATVDVPGTLRAFIRNESSRRAPGTQLKIENHPVSLNAVFNKRLNRALPGFCGNVPITIQYPLQLLAPHCLDCVQKGDRVRFQWSLVNISRKAHGTSGLTGRYIATKFADPGRVFDLPYADAESEQRHEAIDEVDELNPGEEIPIEQDFIVSAAAMEYSDASLHVELLLADPFEKDTNGQQKTRSIMTWDIRMQVSGVYRHDPLSRFLLVINSQTPNWAIHQVISFIRTELHLGLDIFNLSLTGSFIDNATSRPVLPDYRGKSILIWGNNFPYFSRGERKAWQLMDSTEACMLAKAGTGISFIGVQNEVELREWAKQATYAAQLTSKEDANGPPFLSTLITKMQSENQAPNEYSINMEKFQAKPSWWRGLMVCLSAQTAEDLAKKAVKKVDPQLPLRRFLAVPLEGSDDPREPYIGLIEGMPKTSVFFSTVAPPIYVQGGTLLDYHKYMILKTIPFAHRAQIFWNVLGTSQSIAGGDIQYPTLAAYRGLDWHPTQGQMWDTSFIQSKAMTYIGLSIQSTVGSEITQFLTGNAPASMNQLPQLAQLLSTGKSTGKIGLSNAKEQDLLVQTLGRIVGAVYNIGASEWISHKLQLSKKKKLRILAKAGIAEVLKNKYDAEMVATTRAAIKQAALTTKGGIKAAPGNMNKELEPVIAQTLVSLTGINAPLLDLTTLSPNSVAVSVQGFNVLVAQHNQRFQARSEDERGAMEVLARHVNPNLDEEA